MIFLFLFYVLTASYLLYYLITFLIDHDLITWYATRLSPMFILIGNKVCQHPSLIQRKRNRSYKKQGLSTMRLAATLNRDVWEGVFSSKLTPNSEYVTTTHMLSKLRLAERRGIIKIIKVTPKGKRLLIESIAFFSLIHILMNYHSFRKSFYRVTFIYLDTNNTKS